MKKIPTLIFGIIELIVSAIFSSFVYYLLPTINGVSALVSLPLILVGIIIAYSLNLGAGIKLVLTCYSKSKTIKIISIILVFVAILLLFFNGHNIATLINSL